MIGNFTSPIVFSTVVDNVLFLTAHENGQIKLWNLDAGVLIKTYKWKTMATAVLYDPLIQKIYCFIQGGQIKLINTKRFSKDEIDDSEGLNDSIVSAVDIDYGELKAKWAFGSKGDVYAFELV